MTHIKAAARFGPHERVRERTVIGGATTRASALHLMLGASALVVAFGCGGAAEAGSKFKVLFSFGNVKGAYAFAGPVTDSAGNLYGTTFLGGANNDGAVYELSPPTAGKKHWTETVIDSFDGANGHEPLAGLTMDGAGNLYGTTEFGGANSDGVVFELSPPAAGKKHWKETVLQTFTGSNGSNPDVDVIADSAGNLYGTTINGGTNNAGLVYELSPPKKGEKTWAETVLKTFTGTNGKNPQAGLIADAAGNLYGTTIFGGTSGDGVVFELSPPANGQTAWTEIVLLNFDGTDGADPYGNLITDSAGNLYGTASAGGSNGDGVAYELSPPAKGQTTWTQTVLYSFDGATGNSPQWSLLADAKGNLYGATTNGGPDNDGVVFELSPPANGATAWSEKVLAAFNSTNGRYPKSALVADSAGVLYGTTDEGGGNDSGVVFKVTP